MPIAWHKHPGGNTKTNSRLVSLTLGRFLGFIDIMLELTADNNYTEPMPYIKYRRNCNACNLSKKDPVFRRRLRQAAFKRMSGEETIKDVALEFGLTYQATYNHVQKHMTDAEPSNSSRKEIQVYRAKKKIEAEVQQETETVLDAQTIEDANPRPMEIMFIDDVIAQAKKDLADGRAKVTLTNALVAAKIKTDWANKQQNHQLELIRTIAAFRSGSKKQIEQKEKEMLDATGEIAGSLDSGENQAGNLYRAAARNAAARRPEEIPEGIVQPQA